MHLLDIFVHLLVFFLLSFVQVEQRGPYVYTETMEHIGVRYNINKLSFKEWKRQEFDGNATQELCPVCREDDQVGWANNK